MPAAQREAAPPAVSEMEGRMKQAIESFHIGDGQGNETFVPKGKVFPDNHTIPLNAPLHFEDLALDEAPTEPTKRSRGKS